MFAFDGGKMLTFLKNFRHQWKLHILKKAIANTVPLKIIVGAGNTVETGWIATDKEFLDITDEKQWEDLLQNRRAKNVLAEHVIEHLSFAETDLALRNIFRFLSEDGCFRIAVPDGFNIDEDYINYVKPGGWGVGSDDHKVLWNVNALTQLLVSIGYQVSPCQYFTETGQFVHGILKSDNGEIGRKDIDIRTSADFFGGHAKKNSMTYTSLIVDAYKIT